MAQQQKTYPIVLANKKETDVSKIMNVSLPPISNLFQDTIEKHKENNGLHVWEVARQQRLKRIQRQKEIIRKSKELDISLDFLMGEDEDDNGRLIGNHQKINEEFDRLQQEKYKKIIEQQVALGQILAEEARQYEDSTRTIVQSSRNNKRYYWNGLWFASKEMMEACKKAHSEGRAPLSMIQGVVNQTSETLEKEEEKVTKEIMPSEVGSDLIVMRNTSKITDQKKKVYDAIIKAFEEHGMGKATLYMILQSIPFIDQVEDVIVIYLKMPNLLDKINIPCVNIANVVKKDLGENVKLKFVPFANVNIAEYFANIKYKI